MFDIKIGTIIPATAAAAMIPQLNPKGFESYELDFNGTTPSGWDWSAFCEPILSALDEQTISAVGYYGNPIRSEHDRDQIRFLIRNAGKLGCHVVGVFAGADPDKTIPDTIPAFQAVWEPLAAEAEECGVKIGFEGCGGGWWGGSYNIGYCGDAWELMFNAVRSPALGLEWEPTHALEGLADPVRQLRQWGNRVVHVHGKDATVAWDVVREHGITGPVPYVWNRTPGYGDTNWSDLFTILLQNGFIGSCDIEGYHDPVHYDDREWSAQIASLGYLKRCRGGEEWFDGPVEYRGYRERAK